MCRGRILVDPVKFVIILDLPPPMSVTHLRSVLGHTCYYRKFIKGYVEITAPMEKLLKKNAKFQWIESCQEILDKLKRKMETMPIQVFPDWKKQFHVHVHVLSVTLSIVLMQSGEGMLDHHISFSSRKLCGREKLHEDRERGTRHDICVAEVLTLFVGWKFYNVH